jgi:hypothetical protein
MIKKDTVELTEGSRYKIYSIGSREHAMETEGIFKGYTSFGIDEGGMVIELGETHGSMHGRLRILPLHAILAVDILAEKQNEKIDEEKDTSHYYG